MVIIQSSLGLRIRNSVNPNEAGWSTHVFLNFHVFKQMELIEKLSCQ